MTHHVVVSVDVVSTPVLLSARVEASVVLQPALAVIHTHLRSDTFEWNRTISSACYYYMVTHLDRAGIPVVDFQHCIIEKWITKSYVIGYFRGKYSIESPVSKDRISDVLTVFHPPSKTRPSGDSQLQWPAL